MYEAFVCKHQRMNDVMKANRKFFFCLDKWYTVMSSFHENKSLLCNCIVQILESQRNFGDTWI